MLDFNLELSYIQSLNLLTGGTAAAEMKFTESWVIASAWCNTGDAFWVSRYGNVVTSLCSRAPTRPERNNGLALAWWKRRRSRYGHSLSVHVLYGRWFDSRFSSLTLSSSLHTSSSSSCCCRHRNFIYLRTSFSTAATVVAQSSLLVWRLTVYTGPHTHIYIIYHVYYLFISRCLSLILSSSNCT